jgi:MoaA/NifB/PqqE/SkfB family radical SAM enzyme
MVKKAQIGITTRCNSSCAFCLRLELEEKGFIDRAHDMRLETIKNIINQNKDLEEIQLCGNRGEAIYHPEINTFIDLIKSNNKRFVMNTNGDRFDSSWWFDLGQKTNKQTDQVIFALDGLKNAHEFYRKTNFINVFNNLKGFIKGGGNAVWQMILFKNNEKQVDLIKKISKDIGCMETWIINSRRYDEKYEKPEKLFNKTKLEIFNTNPQPKIFCLFEMGKKIYITIDGKAWPCCHTRCYFGFEAIHPQNKFLKLAEEESDLIDVNKKPLDIIQQESKLFKEVFGNIKNLAPCKVLCGNPEIVHSKNRRKIYN